MAYGKNNARHDRSTAGSPVRRDTRPSSNVSGSKGVDPYSRDRAATPAKSSRATERRPQSATSAVRKDSSKLGMQTILIVVLMVGLMMVALPSFIIFATGMVPTFVRLITQQDRNYYSFYTVAALNMAGVLPFLGELWMGDHTVDAALVMIGDVYTLFVMYGSAGAAVALFMVAPHIAAFILSLKASRRLTVLNQAQDRLLKEWGPEVAGEPARPGTGPVIAPAARNGSMRA